MAWVRNVVILAKVDCSCVGFAVTRVVTHWFHAQVGTALSHDCRIRTSKLTNVGDCKLVCSGRYPISRAERGGKYDSSAHKTCRTLVRITPLMRVCIRTVAKGSIVVICSIRASAVPIGFDARPTGRKVR